MPCRDTAVVGVAQAIARANYDADDVQTLSMFAELRRSPAALAQPAPSHDQWVAHLASMSRRAEAEFSGARLARYRSAIMSAAGGERPDGRTFFAMTLIDARVGNAQQAMDNVFESIADTYGTRVSHVREAYKTLVAQNRAIRRADRPPSAPENPGFATANIPQDRATRWALSMLHYGGPQAATSEAIRDVATHRGATASQRCGGCGEFMGSGGHVCPETAAQTSLPTAPPAAPRRRLVTVAPEVGTTVVEEPPAVEQTPPRETSRRTSERRYEVGGRMLRTLNRSAMRERTREVPGETIGIPVAIGLEGGIVRGEIGIRDSLPAGRRWGRTRTGDRYEVARDSSRRLRCSCAEYRANYDCPHVREAEERVRAWANEREPRPAVVPQDVTENVNATLSDDAEAARRATQADQAVFDAHDDGVSYSDMDVFQQDWDEIRQRQRSGDTAVTYMTEDATGGLSSRENGRAFGIEIEIDFPDDQPDGMGVYRARHRYAQALHEAGLSQWDHPLGWQPFRESGRGVVGGGHTDEANRWSVQHDSSVDGLNGRRGAEIVSPILYDEPHTWNNIQTVLDLARQHGGKVTVKTGLHVNVSGADFNHTLENYNNLISMVDRFEDPLIRCATNPHREDTRWHRGRAYCTPVTAPAAGFRTIREAVAHHDHHAMISLSSMPSERQPVTRGTRVEFRQFDGTLDAGRLQAHVKMSLAMMSAAKRGVTASDMTAEPAGSHRQRNYDPRRQAMPRLTGEAWEEDTRSFRRLADVLFARAADKKQFLELFASSRWQRPANETGA